MRSTALIHFVFASLAGMAIVGIASRSGDNSGLLTTAIGRGDLVAKKANPYDALDDESLREKFLSVSRELGFPMLHQGIESSKQEAAHAHELMREELRNRGTKIWTRVIAQKEPLNVARQTDTQLLILLEGIPNEDDMQGAAIYQVVIQEALARGGEWIKLAQDLNWSEFAGLSDAQIGTILGEAQIGRFSANHLETVLMEVIRRGSPSMEKLLEDQLKADAKQMSEPKDIFRLSGRNLPMLTALRRIQKKPDPMGIKLIRPSVEVVQFPHLPSFDVALINQDVDKAPFLFTRGGDYRTGRQARWRIEARDKEGKMLPTLTRFGGFMGGGLYNEGVLEAGETWETTLSASSYLPALPPGEYTLRIMYHDQTTIADQVSIDGEIVSTSPDIHLTVKPLIVQITSAEADAIKSQLNAIRDEPMKLVAGTYGEWAYGFVSKDSDQGKILDRGLAAVPILIDLLYEKKRSPKQVALVLGLLYSLTGQNDPRQEGMGSEILGAYEAKEGPWSLASNGRLMGFSFGGSEKVMYPMINIRNQELFAERWKAWKDCIKVETRE